MEWAKQQYNKQYDAWVPWLEDLYLRYFTKDNKASYSTKRNLEKTKVSGLDQIDKLQDGVNDLAAGQVGQGGIAQPIGDAFSKQAINRAERQGKNDKGGYLPDQGGVLARGGDSLLGGVADGGRKAAGAAQDGLSSTSNGNLQVSLQSSP